MAFDRIRFFLDKIRFYSPSWLLNKALKILGGKRVLADYYLSRTLNVGISYSDAIRIFKRINSLEDWIPSWYRLGLEREAMAVKAEEEKRDRSSVELWMMARAAFYIAQFPYFKKTELKDKIYHRCVEAFKYAAPKLSPPAVRLEIPFRSISLPAYLRIPANGTPEICLVIIGGIDGVKEEIHYYSDYFVRRGFSVLTFDPPGIGESWLRVKMDPDYGSVAEAVTQYLRKYEEVKFSNFGILGLSLGGNIAMHFAARNLVQSCIVVSPPFEPHLYFYKLFFLIRQAAQHVIGGNENLDVFLKQISLKEVVPKIRCPLFVIGGAMDAILPGEEALKVYEHASCPKRLLYYEDGTHVCPEYSIEMMGEIEKWFRQTLK